MTPPGNTVKSREAHIWLIMRLPSITPDSHQGTFQQGKSKFSPDEADDMAVLLIPFVCNEMCDPFQYTTTLWTCTT